MGEMRPRFKLARACPFRPSRRFRIPTVATSAVPELELPAGYRLVARLGVGGFGEVWRADGPDGEPVALKIVELSQRKSEDEFQALYLVANVRHPHLLHLIGHWVSDEHLMIATELADETAEDLARRYREQGHSGLPQPQLLALLSQAAEAVDFLNSPIHEHGGRRVAIQHRDLKPENIFLFGSHVRVGDFGLAKILEHLSCQHSGKGTLLYSPPEMLEGKVAHTSDQYSLALTYCKLRTGEIPFPGETMLEKLWSRAQGPPDLAAYPSEERAVLQKALDRNPADRFPSAAAFVRALAAVAGGATTGVTRPEASLTASRTTILQNVPAISARDSTLVVQGARPLPAGYLPVAGCPIHESGFPLSILCEMDGGEMVLVPEGEYAAGPPRQDGSFRRVYLGPYYIDKYPVTNAQFQWFCRQAEYHRADRFSWGDDGHGLVNKAAHPAVWLTWDDAMAYCQWSGKTLPTEAQWEKAARGIDGRPFPWGFEKPSESPTPRLNARGLLPLGERTSPVGSFPDGASPFGACDMLGNVWEWCWDWYDADPPPGGYRNPQGPPTGKYRVLRGGSWANSLEIINAYFRNHLAPEVRGPTTGFRGVLKV